MWRKPCAHVALPWRLPDVDCSAVLEQVHAPRYLAFSANRLANNGWRWTPPTLRVQPSIGGPVRTLRSDVSPTTSLARDSVCIRWTTAPHGGRHLGRSQGGGGRGGQHRRSRNRHAKPRFACTRPPGHHAGPDFMGAVASLNNAAVMARRPCATRAPRVAVLDVDYHHGNGTQAWLRPQRCAVHQHPRRFRTEYPLPGPPMRQGRRAGAGFNLNPPPASTSAATRFDAR